MKLFQGSKQWLSSVKQEYHEAKAARRAQMLDNLSCTDINIIEFSGRLYVAYNGTPVVRVEDIRDFDPECNLGQYRQDYLVWKQKFNR